MDLYRIPDGFPQFWQAAQNTHLLRNQARRVPETQNAPAKLLEGHAVVFLENFPTSVMFVG